MLLQRAGAAEPLSHKPPSFSVELQDPAALCLQESNLRNMLTLMVKKDCPALVCIMPLVKDNISAEEHRLPRGEKMCASVPFVHTLYITLSLNSAAASSSIRGPALPPGEPGLLLSSVQMDKRCWLWLAEFTNLGLPFPAGDSYETCSQSCPCFQALCSTVLLSSGLQQGLEPDVA